MISKVHSLFQTATTLEKLTFFSQPFKNIVWLPANKMQDTKELKLDLMKLNIQTWEIFCHVQHIYVLIKLIQESPIPSDFNNWHSFTIPPNLSEPYKWGTKLLIQYTDWKHWVIDSKQINNNLSWLWINMKW